MPHRRFEQDRIIARHDPADVSAIHMACDCEIKNNSTRLIKPNQRGSFVVPISGKSSSVTFGKAFHESDSGT